MTFDPHARYRNSARVAGEARHMRCVTGIFGQVRDALWRDVAGKGRGGRASWWLGSIARGIPTSMSPGAFDKVT